MKFCTLQWIPWIAIYATSSLNNFSTLCHEVPNIHKVLQFYTFSSLKLNFVFHNIINTWTLYFQNFFFQNKTFVRQCLLVLTFSLMYENLHPINSMPNHYLFFRRSHSPLLLELFYQYFFILFFYIIYFVLNNLMMIFKNYNYFCRWCMCICLLNTI